LSSTQILSPAEQNSTYDGSAPVAVDPNGNALYTWENQALGIVQGRARSAMGVLSTTDDLSATGATGHSPQVGVDQSGNAVFIWERSDGTTDCDGSGCFRIQARSRSAAGALGLTQTISAAGLHAEPSPQPQIAVTPTGSAVTVWQSVDTGTPDPSKRDFSIEGAVGP
jgi:hypothetical protein